MSKTNKRLFSQETLRDIYDFSELDLQDFEEVESCKYFGPRWKEMNENQREMVSTFYMDDINPKTGEFDFEKSASWDCKVEICNRHTHETHFKGQGVYYNVDGASFPEEGIEFSLTKHERNRLKRINQ